MIYSFREFIPVIHPSSFIHPLAAVTGHVVIGKNCYIGPGAALRGDWGKIIIEDGCNVQENCILHMFPGLTVWLKKGAHIGHGAIIHGATIGRNCLVGMNAVIMDNAELGNECIVGALTLIRGNERFARRSLIVGNPGTMIKKVSDEMMKWKTTGTEIYQSLPADMMEHSKIVEPLRRMPAGLPRQDRAYRPWKQSSKKQ